MSPLQKDVQPRVSRITLPIPEKEFVSIREIGGQESFLQSSHK